MSSHFILSLLWQRLNTVSWIKASTALPYILLHGMLYSDKQCWGRYFYKVTRYILLFTLKKVYVLQLHIT